MDKSDCKNIKGVIFNIQRFSVHDGPGIRTIIFFKGCPLTCIWCSNPESKDMGKQILFNSDRCIGCGACINICTNQAAALRQKGDKALKHQCENCSLCIGECNTLALSLSGEEKTAAQIYDEVKKDRLFYKNSQGGVTLSGGEPLMQPEFARAILKLCKEAGYSTCMETSGYADWKVFMKVLPYLEHVLYDVKHMDDERHMQLTGVSNKFIQENLERVLQTGIKTRIRFPLIPQCNDTEKNIEMTALRMIALGVKHIDILPYHNLGSSKYKGLMWDYPLAHIKPPSDERVLYVKDKFVTFGLQANIGG